MVRLTLEEIRRLRGEPLPEEELRRAKDHIKGGLLLSLEGSGARMNHLARQELYFGRQLPLDEILGGDRGGERATTCAAWRRRSSTAGSAASVLGNLAGLAAARRAPRELTRVQRMTRFRVLGSGSGGNATLVEGGGARVLLDAGLGPRQLAERLQSAGVDPAALDAVFVSHEHGDHARGAAAFSARWGVPLVGTRGTFARRRLRRRRSCRPTRRSRPARRAASGGWR